MKLETPPELAQFRERVRAFVAQRSPARKVHTGTRAPDPELIGALRVWTAALFEAGYLGIDWPAEHGGRPDAHPLESSIVAEELARASAWPPVGGGTLAATAIIEFGTAQQQDYFLPRIRNSEDLWCQLFSEPGAGSDLASLQTRARRDGENFVVDGQKVWTTNGQHADVGYLLARTNPDVPNHRGITAFALDMRTQGVQVRPLREITGTSDFNEVFFDSVVIAADRVIGAVDDGWRVAMHSLAHERSGLAARGVALSLALEQLADLAVQPLPGRPPAASDSDVRQRLGALTARLNINTAMTAMTQSDMLAGVEDVVGAPASKVFFSELNLDIATFGVALQGTDGVLTESDPKAVADGWWQDAFLYSRGYTIAAGANEVMRNVISERGLGLPRDP